MQPIGPYTIMHQENKLNHSLGENAKKNQSETNWTFRIKQTVKKVICVLNSVVIIGQNINKENN